jgi:hypothetical protein
MGLAVLYFQAVSKFQQSLLFPFNLKMVNSMSAKKGTA